MDTYVYIYIRRETQSLFVCAHVYTYTHILCTSTYTPLCLDDVVSLACLLSYTPEEPRLQAKGIMAYTGSIRVRFRFIQTALWAPQTWGPYLI